VVLLMTPGAFTDGVPQTAEAFLALRFHTLTAATVGATSAEGLTIAVVASASVRVILLITNFDQSGVRRGVSVIGHRVTMSRTRGVSTDSVEALAMRVGERVTSLSAGKTSRICRRAFVVATASERGTRASRSQSADVRVISVYE